MTARTRDLEASEIKWADRSILADRVARLQDERRNRTSDLEAAIAWAAEEFRRCIVAARCAVGGDGYAKNNGRAEAYRQLTAQVCEAAGVDVPDWEAIKVAVPPDGIYR